LERFSKISQFLALECDARFTDEAVDWNGAILLEFNDDSQEFIKAKV
jgi:hypothetical protein